MPVVEARRGQTVGLTVVDVPAEATHDLRRRVLRGGAADAPVVFVEDAEPGTIHLAVDEGGIVAVATFIPAPPPASVARTVEGATYQLRGMAVDAGRQGRGIGRALLTAGSQRLCDLGAVLLWANARDSALGFYERLGWQVVGDGYIHGPMGLPHHLALLELG